MNQEPGVPSFFKLELQSRVVGAPLRNRSDTGRRIANPPNWKGSRVSPALNLLNYVSRTMLILLAPISQQPAELEFPQARFTAVVPFHRTIP